MDILNNNSHTPRPDNKGKSMPLIVQKFGGTSVADAKRIKNKLGK